ncbi:hypothetical protein GCM10010231_66290 [Streptomyces sindenensis]|nr:hypothetical protein GCM10010231_66290 [Streptomyces sindenensis]
MSRRLPGGVGVRQPGPGPLIVPGRFGAHPFGPDPTRVRQFVVSGRVRQFVVSGRVDFCQG